MANDYGRGRDNSECPPVPSVSLMPLSSLVSSFGRIAPPPTAQNSLTLARQLNIIRQERIAIINGRNKSFLYASHRYTTHHIDFGACFVVCARSSCAAERLLPDYGSGGLVIDIKISCRMTQFLRRQLQSISVLRKNRTCEGVGRSAVNQVQHFFKFIFGVNINSDHRPKNFFAHGERTGVLREN